MCFSLPRFSIYRALKHEKKKHLTGLKFLIIKNIDLANCVSAHDNTGKATVNPEGNIFRYEIKFINTYYFPFNLILRALVSRQLASQNE